MNTQSQQNQAMPKNAEESPRLQASQRRFRLITLNLWHGQANGLQTSVWQSPPRSDFAGLSPLPRSFAPVGEHSPFAAAMRDLAQLQPDVIVFQEADFRQLRSEGADQPAQLAAALKMPYVAFQPMYTGQTWGLRLPAPIVRTPRDPAYVPARMRLGAFGVGIASRWPLVHIRGIRLGAAWPRLWQGKKFQPYPGFNRAAVSGNVRFPNGHELSVATTHLELVPAVAKHQLAYTWRFAARRKQPTILAGDFNLTATESTQILSELPSWINEAPQLQVNTVPSYPVGAPKRALDTLVSSDVAVKQLAALALPISDHCAVVADCEFTQ